MTDLSWFEVYPPRGCDLADVTAALRPLAGRGRRGVLRETPVVVFELWLRRGAVRWLIGMDRRLAPVLPRQITAQLPRLGLAACPRPDRPQPTGAMEVRVHGLSALLRLDMAKSVAAGLLHVPNTLGQTEVAVVQWIVGPSAPRRVHLAEFHVGEVLGLRAPAKPEAAQRAVWREKVSEPLFGVRGRLGTVAGEASRTNGIIKQLNAALCLANGSHAQLLGRSVTTGSGRRLIDVVGQRRTWSSILNAAELGTLLGWPLDNLPVPGGDGPGLGPAPKTLLIAPDDTDATTGRTLGVSLHPADAGQLVRMPAHSSTHHLHLIGPTGSGKSNLLAQFILADAAGHGVLVIEPKGDLVEDVLARLPKSRHDDVVLIEPSDTAQVVGLNPLAGPAEQAERRADELLHLFKELFGTAIGPRSGDVLLHALITAARLPDGCLTDVPTLLTNDGLRRRALAKVNDPLVLGPFWAGFNGLSDAERVHVVAPLMNKLRVFVARASLRRMLGQAAPRFQLDELFTERRIVLVNLNKGLIGPETSRVLGALLLQQCWQVIQRQAAVPAGQRQMTSLFLDEWQDYTAAVDFGDLLAQCRGLGVGVTVAHQHLAQLSPSLRAGVMANARSRLAFRPAQDDARALAAVLGGGLIPEDLERLGAFQACARVLVDSAPSAPFAVQTLPLPESANDVAALRQAALDRYGIDGAGLDEQLQARWHGPGPNTDGPIGVSKRRHP